MRKIGRISLVAVTALTLAAGVTRATPLIAADQVQVARETQPGDDRGGHGGDDVRLARETQPGDDRGGHGGGDA